LFLKKINFYNLNFILDQKKIKRRQYYAKRRQSQGKDVNSTVIPKKRHRKVIKNIYIDIEAY